MTYLPFFACSTQSIKMVSSCKILKPIFSPVKEETANCSHTLHGEEEVNCREPCWALPVAAEDQEETGWKYIHGDVFRFPAQKNVFCALVGTGAQLFTLSIFIFILACIGIFYPYNRGALYTALIVLYSLTAGPPPAVSHPQGLGFRV